MQTDQITLVHNRRTMRLSGIYRCIFTDRAMLWLVDSNGFKLVDMLKRKQLFICGRQGSGKTTLAKMISAKLQSMGYFISIVDEIRHEVHLEQLMLNAKHQRTTMILNQQTPYDLVIYSCQSDFLVPIEYRDDMILLNS